MFIHHLKHRKLAVQRLCKEALEYPHSWNLKDPPDWCDGIVLDFRRLEDEISIVLAETKEVRAMVRKEITYPRRLDDTDVLLQYRSLSTTPYFILVKLPCSQFWLQYLFRSASLRY
jgi:hypothetical protein